MFSYSSLKAQVQQIREWSVEELYIRFKEKEEYYSLKFDLIWYLFYNS